MTLTKSSIMSAITVTNQSNIEKLSSCLDAYHDIDLLSEPEEEKFALRNLILVKINDIRGKVPMAVRQSVAQWLYSEKQWNDEKGQIL